MHATEPLSQSIQNTQTEKSIACPAIDFSVFIKSFSENTDVQRAFTNTPLHQRLDLAATPDPKPIVRKIRRDQVSFPVMPSREDLITKNLSMQVDEVSTQSAKVVIYKNDADYQVSYEFKFNGCWNLIAIEDQSLTQAGSKNKWLERLFPKIKKCTPRSLYFDESTKRSNNGLLESFGYSPYKIDAEVARYKINEKFYGLTATEIGIPSGTSSIYYVTVAGDISKISATIFEKTKIAPDLYKNNFKPKSGVAYLISEAKDRSTFACFTFEE